MLVLFIYVASLASNEFFDFSMKYFFIFIITAFASFFIFMSLDPLLLSWKVTVPYSSLAASFTIIHFIKWIYSGILRNFTLFIILYLLLTLLVVVKITGLIKGPLRLLN